MGQVVYIEVSLNLECTGRQLVALDLEVAVVVLVQQVVAGVPWGALGICTGTPTGTGINTGSGSRVITVFCIFCI
jgi:hypothetical protein